MSYIPVALEADEQERKLFIGGLNKYHTDEDRLRKFFCEYGKIVDVTIMRDNDKQSRGFGFVLFENASSVNDIIANKKAGASFELDDHQIEVKRALPKVPGGNAGTSRTGGLYRKVFVGGLPSSITEDDLRSHFEKFGAVHEVDLLRDRDTNRLRGFAFVTFEDEDSADKCIQKRAQEICKKFCEIKRAQTRSTLTKYESDDRNDGNRRQDHPLTDRLFKNGPTASQQTSLGVMNLNEVNQLIQQAYAMGQQSVLQNTGLQAPTATALLGLGGVASYTQSVNNTLLQALMNQAPPAVSLPGPIVPSAGLAHSSNAANANTINQLAQLLNGKGIDVNALSVLLNKDQDTNRAPLKSNSGTPGYATGYPASSSYDMYYNSQSSQYGPSKEDEKRPAYRPY
ncbi:uncharacterized protein LOC100213955 [Hydra vulgaris]|uniref:uncharacterized protein LOC100213955 n=1 Tax=Hydra vulgaris TaxID=6087 RepID=UPI00019253D1|nr:nuclear polyadenylated RNA-binding protein 4 [Hydra vulgaris]